MDFARFKALASEYSIIPIWRDLLLDTDTPVSAFAKLRTGAWAFLLESAPAGSETWSRYTFMGTEPQGAWRLNGNVVDEWSPALGWHGTRTVEDPLADLERQVTGRRVAFVPELGAFWGGAVGYLGYDVVRSIERLPDGPPRVLNIPDALFIFTRGVVVIDNLRAQGRLVISVVVPADATEDQLHWLYDGARAEIDMMEHRLREHSTLRPLVLDPAAPPASGETTYDQTRFIADVETIKEYIRAGDCFQALLARRISLPHDFLSGDLYRALRVLNPSPYMYHLALNGVELVGSSPELLVRVADGRVTVRPIAGTRPRGATPADDERLSAELLADGKERAEHVMLVDLGRNDVGRIAEYNSVEVTSLMQVEKYSHVFHIVSQVEGTLRPGLSAAAVLKAVFPAGTMTGAPKVRAMEIIDELEPERRGAYAGAIGYIAWGGERMDLAITIRTCVFANGTASVQAGAGIVADSVPLTEWEETENKARALLKAIGQVRASLHPGRA
ncbi:MAG: anthranilate synthase component I family protein [Gemmatimonadaceae bacterium]